MPGASAIDIYTCLRIYCLNNKIPKYVIVNIDTFKRFSNNEPTISNIHNFIKHKKNKQLSCFSSILKEHRLLNYPLLQYCIAPSWGFREVVVSPKVRTLQT